MIVEINDSLIETEEIENITPVYVDYLIDGATACFTIYLKTSYIKVKGKAAEWGEEPEREEVAEKRKKLYDIWRGDNEITTI